MDWSLFIAILALTFSVFVYVSHDRKLKKQEGRLNDYQLQKIVEEKNEKSMAAIRANVIKHDKGRRVIKIFNSGKAIARNIRVEVLNDDHGLIFLDFNDRFPFPFMNPQDSSEFSGFITEAPTNNLHLKIIWDDSSGENRTYNQLLTL